MTPPQKERIGRLAERVRQQFLQDHSGHDWWHVWRVWRLARKIAGAEGANLYVVELAALCHDLEDWKLHASPRIAEWLAGLEAEPEVIEQVVDICQRISFKGAGVPDDMQSLEGRVVQDADRLDAIGAIGIARTFAFGGARERLLYDPSDPPKLHDSFETYKSKSGSSLNHFYEKLLLLKDRMHTQTARKIALERHRYMQEFVARFMDEWNGVR